LPLPEFSQTVVARGCTLMEFDDDLWPGDWREIGTAAKDIAAHKGFDLAVAKVAVCRTTFSDGKVNKRLVEYEWDEYRQVLVADQSRGVASMSTTGRSSARTVLIGQRPATRTRIQPKKRGDPRRTQKSTSIGPTSRSTSYITCLPCRLAGPAVIGRGGRRERWNELWRRCAPSIQNYSRP
jgi:hypothetical protein